MPAPGDLRPARLDVSVSDHLWDWLYVAPAGFILNSARKIDRFQFLPIRTYLVLMFISLIALLLLTVAWF